MATQSDRVSGYDVPEPGDRPSDPDRIRREIERTRAELAGDVDRLADRTSPSRVARRNWNQVTARMNSIKESVMGAPSPASHSIRTTAQDAGGRVQDSAQRAADGVQGVAHAAADAVRQGPETLARQTRGNPLAAGLIAFGAGLLAATLLPESDAERQAGRKLAEHSDDLADKVRQPLSEIKQDVKQSAQQAAAEVKDTARDAAQSTAQTARSSAQDVKETAQDPTGNSSTVNYR
jgi:hypothetical protein